MTQTLSTRAHEVMSEDESPVFLATLDERGRPNCIPVVTLMPYENDKLIFGDFMLNKTRSNLESNPNVGVALFSQALEGWSIKGTFLGFETHGERFDLMNRSPLFRYNAYTGVRAVGLIQLEQVSDRMAPSRWKLVRHYARALATASLMRKPKTSRECMPKQVEEKFQLLSALRALAFNDTDGFPRAFPILSCFSAGPNRLVIADPFLEHYKDRMPAETEVAISVLTPKAVSYQVKGHCANTQAKTTIVELTECYSASPPLVGDRLDGSSGSVRVQTNAIRKSTLQE